MAISFVNAGAEGSAASGNITLGAPASPATNDIWIAVIHSSDQVAHTFTDWTQIVQGNGGGTTSRISVWYFRYAGSNPNLTVGHTAGQSPIGGIAAYRGCKTSGSPVNVSGSITGGTDASIEHAAVTPTVANCALLVCNGAADDNDRTALGGDYGVAFEDSAANTQNCYQTTAGTPDGSVCIFHDISVPASGTGIVTVTQAAADPWASVLIALEPDLTQTLTLTAPVATVTAPSVVRVATISRTAGAATATITAPSVTRVATITRVLGAPTATITAPSVTRTTTVSLTAGVPTVTFSAPAVAIPSSQTVDLGVPVVTVTAPSVTRVAQSTLVATAPVVTFTAPSTTLSTTITRIAGAPVTTISAPSTTRLTTITRVAGVPVTTITAPSVSRIGITSLALGVPRVLFTAPAATVSTGGAPPVGTGGGFGWCGWSGMRITTMWLLDGGN